jgi:hypothetical protein
MFDLLFGGWFNVVVRCVIKSIGFASHRFATTAAFWKYPNCTRNAVFDMRQNEPKRAIIWKTVW